MLDPRAITRIALAPDWSLGASVAEAELAGVDAAIENLSSLPSLMQSEPALDPNVEGSASAELRKWLKPIGMTNWPEAKWDRTEWLNATMLALSDLPAKIVVKATMRAISKPFSFPNQVQPGIREIAAEMIERHNLALLRLRIMRREIERAMRPAQPRLEQRPERPVTQEQVNVMNRNFRRFGARTRWRLEADGTVSDFLSLPIDEAELQADIGGGTQGD